MFPQLLACFICLWTHADIWKNCSFSSKKVNMNTRLTIFANVMKTFLKSKTTHHNEIDISMFEDTTCAVRKIYETNFQHNKKISPSSCNPPRIRIIWSQYVFLSKGMGKQFLWKFPVWHNRSLQLKQSSWISNNKP